MAMAPERNGSVTAASSEAVVLTKMVKRADFLRMNGTPHKYHAAGFVLLARPRSLAHGSLDGTARIGYTASRKVGGAVQRNRAKRRLRALVAEILPPLVQPDWDFVLIAREATVVRDWKDLQSDLEVGLRKIRRSLGPPTSTRATLPVKES